MRRFSIFIFTSILFAQPALSAVVSCDAQADKRQLSGNSRENFVKKCQMSERLSAGSCEGQADTRKLVGTAKNSFVRKCYESMQVPVPRDVYCETEAEQKKLDGKARTSFMKKCETGKASGKGGK